MADSLYNPDTMSKEEIKALFVARQPLLDELVETIENQPKGAGVQHALIISPRGMGKTTMLLMLQFAVEDSKKLSKNWRAIRFPEESYDITELADLWLKVLDYLDDENINSKVKEIKEKFQDSEDLREAAWAIVKDWSKKHKKRIVLLVDNFNDILYQINNDTEQARLRDILMNDGTIMLIGCSPSYFKAITDYDQPLYNFFKTYQLYELKFPEIEELLRNRSKIDDLQNIEELLKKNKTRIKALEAFTGGNPRLVLMLYRIIINSDMTEVRDGLDKLLDAVTPYYKDKTEKLPPQQRKILNEIAKYSLETSEGVSPTEIAKRIRMTPNQVSSQLKRMAGNGYVKALNVKGRSNYYAISEPLYVIWSQMRFGRNARERRQWLVQILKVFFDLRELRTEISKIKNKIKDLNGHETSVKGTLEYLVCLLETNPSLIEANYSLAIETYLKLQDIASVKSEITSEKLPNLSSDTIEKLEEKGIINLDDLVVESLSKILDSFEIFLNDIKEKKYEETSIKLEITKELLEELPESIRSLPVVILMLSMVHVLRANIFIGMENYDLVISEYENAITNLENSNTEEHVNTIFQLSVVEVGVLLFQKKDNIAGKVFKKFVSRIKKQKPQNWIEILTENLAIFLKFVEIRKIIKLANLEDELFSLVRAIDYFETKNEDLLEKLSPEVRIVVEEVVNTLEKVLENKSKMLKSKSKRTNELPIVLST